MAFPLNASSFPQNCPAAVQFWVHTYLTPYSEIICYNNFATTYYGNIFFSQKQQK